MKKIWLLVCIIVISIIIDLFISIFVFIDYFMEYKTIKISNQDSYISKEIKEHFNIDYDIKKVKFYGGIPDGYYLDVYGYNQKNQNYFEDNHEDSIIYDYFKVLKADVPKHLKYLILAMLIEIITIVMVCRKNDDIQNEDNSL